MKLGRQKNSLKKTKGHQDSKKTLKKNKEIRFSFDILRFIITFWNITTSQLDHFIKKNTPNWIFFIISMVLALDNAKGKNLIGWDWIIMVFFVVVFGSLYWHVQTIERGVVWPMTCKTLNLVLFLISKSLMEGLINFYF